MLLFPYCVIPLGKTAVWELISKDKEVFGGGQENLHRESLPSLLAHDPDQFEKQQNSQRRGGGSTF